MTANRAWVVGFTSSLVAGILLWLVVNDQVNTQVADLKKQIQDSTGIKLP